MLQDAQTIAFSRFGLGARPGDRIDGDPREWVLGQMARFDPAPAAMAGMSDRAAIVARLAEYRDEAQAARKKFKQRQAAAAPEDMASIRKDLPPNPGRALSTEAAGARIDVALQSDTPFVERLVHFWSNHFAVSLDKRPVDALVGDYEFNAIRPHVLGSFSQLLNAAVLHPAMMMFLDQAQSIGPESQAAQRVERKGRGKALGLNENLAREILELHTLGVRTGYSQADVTEFARALTGWTVAGFAKGRLARLVDGSPGDTMFAPVLHEPGARTIMGRRFDDDGADQARAVLSMLAVHPATARHIAMQLARHFIADDPPAEAVARLERAFLASDGDLPTVYRALVGAPEPWEPQPGKFRNPWDWSVAALRATGTRTMPGKRVVVLLKQLGQPLWQPGSPAGWGDTAADWAGPGSLMTRVEIAQAMAGAIGDRIDARELAPVILPGALTDETATAIARSEQSATGLALLLCSPEFLRR